MTGLRLTLALLMAVGLGAHKTVMAADDEFILEDFSGDKSALETQWRGVSDQVMGGISQETLARGVIEGRQALRLTGRVRLENNGGFIQMSLPLAAGRETFDASTYDGLRVTVRGNGERYSLHLRTPDNVRPWQSYRAHFTAHAEWQTIDLPFERFEPHRLTAPLDVSRLRRLGLVAIGRAFDADLAVARIALYRHPKTGEVPPP